MLLLNA